MKGTNGCNCVIDVFGWLPVRSMILQFQLILNRSAFKFRLKQSQLFFVVQIIYSHPIFVGLLCEFLKASEYIFSQRRLSCDNAYFGMPAGFNLFIYVNGKVRACHFSLFMNELADIFLGILNNLIVELEDEDYWYSYKYDDDEQYGRPFHLRNRRRLILALRSLESLFLQDPHLRLDTHLWLLHSYYFDIYCNQQWAAS